MDAINESIREKNPDVSIDELEGADRLEDVIEYDDEEEEESDQEDDLEDQDDEPVLPSSDITYTSTRHPLKSPTEILPQHMHVSLPDPERGHPIEPIETFAGVAVTKHGYHDAWQITSDKEKIINQDRPIFLESNDDIEGLKSALQDRFPGRVENSNYRDRIFVWDRLLFSSIVDPRGLNDPAACHESVLELRKMAVKHGSVLVDKNIIRRLQDNGYIDAISGFESTYDEKRIGLVMGGFIVEWATDSRKALFIYNQDRFDRAITVRKGAAKRKKKKQEERKALGLLDITGRERNYICGFRTWILHCLQQKFPVFAKFRYMGNTGRGTPKTCQDIKDLLNICNKMKVDFRKNYSRSKDKRTRAAESDYSQVHYREFIKNMIPYAKSMRYLRHKKEVGKDAIAAIHWLSRWIEREAKS